MELRASCKSSAPSQLLLYFSISWGVGAGRVTAIWTLTLPLPGECLARPGTGVWLLCGGHWWGKTACALGHSPLPRCKVQGMVSLPPPWPGTPPRTQLHPPQLTSPRAPPSRSDPRTNEHLSQLFSPLSDLGDLLRRSPRSAGHRRPRVCSRGRACLPVSPPLAPEDGQHVGGPVGSQGPANMGRRCPETAELRDGPGRLPLCAVQLGGRPGQSQAPGRGIGPRGSWGCLASHLEQQLVLGDPLDWLQQVGVQAQLVVQLLLALLHPPHPLRQPSPSLRESASGGMSPPQPLDGCHPPSESQ